MSEPKLAECDDVEITPEMIEAGVEALWEFDCRDLADGWLPKEDVVIAVHAAVRRARREGL